MQLSKRQRTQLEKIITQVEKILMQADAAEKRVAKSQRTAAFKKTGRKSLSKNRAPRRSRADAAAMRKEIKAARKKGTSATELAKKYGVTTSYVYQQR
jgi:Mor family transcriptional regulator